MPCESGARRSCFRGRLLTTGLTGGIYGRSIRKPWRKKQRLPVILRSVSDAGYVMVERKKKTQDDAANLASLKPFRLVKFFSYSGLAVFLLFTLVLSWIISNHAKKVLLERSEAYAFVVAENLSHQVFQQFVLPTVMRYGEIALRKPEQFARLDTVVRNATHGMRIQAVTIF